MYLWSATLASQFARGSCRFLLVMQAALALFASGLAWSDSTQQQISAVSPQISSCNDRDVQGLTTVLRSCFVSNKQAAYFMAGSKIWRSTGRATRPITFKDRRIARIIRLVAATDRFIYFFAWDGVSRGPGSSNQEVRLDLWRTSASGKDTKTVRLARDDFARKAFLNYFGTIGDQVFFVRRPKDESTTLFQLSRVGDKRARLINLTGIVKREKLDHQLHRPLAFDGEYVYFVSRRKNTSQLQLWRAHKNGGAKRIKKLPQGSFLVSMIAGDSKIYFQLEERSNSTSTCTLWRSDGTARGTLRFFTSTDDEPPTNKLCSNGSMVTLGDTLLFKRWKNQREVELLRSEGNTRTTRVIKSLPRISRSNVNTRGIDQLTGLTVFKNRAWFTGYNSDIDGEVWVSNGTNAGTQVVSAWKSPLYIDSHMIPGRNRMLLAVRSPADRKTLIYSINASGQATRLVRLNGKIKQKVILGREEPSIVLPTHGHAIFLTKRSRTTIGLMAYDLRRKRIRIRGRFDQTSETIHSP